MKFYFYVYFHISILNNSNEHLFKIHKTYIQIDDLQEIESITKEFCFIFFFSINRNVGFSS